jgi:hypothetical protein
MAVKLVDQKNMLDLRIAAIALFASGAHEADCTHACTHTVVVYACSSVLTWTRIQTTILRN